MATISLSYEDWVRRELSAGSVVLDAGCGDGDFGVVKEVLEVPLRLVGIDIDENSLKSNDKYDNLICASVEQLPFKEELFDLVVSRFVFEHLQDPNLAFREMARVLNDGGSIIILTQNLWNPLMFMSYLLPLGFRRWITRRVFRSEEDEGRFETYYRCNSKRRFESLVTMWPGFELEIFHRYNASTLHLWKNPVMKAFFSLVERLLSLEIFSLFRGSLIVKLKKRIGSGGSSSISGEMP
jgi:ubiquinone/menaquinone biosynthesis C-methylase UbiE